MVKITVFGLLVLGIMFYPLTLGNRITVNGKKIKTVKLPEVEFEKGNFLIYDTVLEKKGKFDLLKIYKKEYIVYNLNMADLIKAENYKASKTVFKKSCITGYNVTYKNRDLELITNKAFYDKNRKILKGGQFRLYSKDYRGVGSSFVVNSKKDLYARDITYYLKVGK
ncbi:hypothetical protein [Nautilia sp.]